MDRKERYAHILQKKIDSFAELGGEAVLDCERRWGRLIGKSRRIPSGSVKGRIVARWIKIISGKIREELPERYHVSALMAVLQGALSRDLDFYEIGIERLSPSPVETKRVK